MIEQTCRTHLLSLAADHAKANDIALATVSRMAHGSHFFLEKFKAGEVSITLKKYDKMLQWFQKNRIKAPALKLAKIISNSGGKRRRAA